MSLRNVIFLKMAVSRHMPLPPYTFTNSTSNFACRFLVSMGDFRENSLVVWSAFDGLSSPVVLVTTKTISPVHQVCL